MPETTVEGARDTRSYMRRAPRYDILLTILLYYVWMAICASVQQLKIMLPPGSSSTHLQDRRRNS